MEVQLAGRSRRGRAGCTGLRGGCAGARGWGGSDLGFGEEAAGGGLNAAVIGGPVEVPEDLRAAALQRAMTFQSHGTIRA